MKRLPLNFLLALLLLFTFTIVAFATETTEITESAVSTENTESSEISGTTESSENSIINPDEISSSTEIPQDTPSENIQNTDPTPKPNPDTAPKSSSDIESTLSPNPKEPVFESAFSSLDVIAIRDDLYNIRKLMEDFTYVILPLFVAVVLIVLGCYWFYCTFIKGVL